MSTTSHLLRYRSLPWAVTLTVMALTATSCLAQYTQPSLEQQAVEIGRSLMCPVCPSETVDQSQVELAKQMRAIIRENLAAGESRQDILDFFVNRYGEDVLAAPPKSGFSLLVWTLPGVGIMSGAIALYLLLRAMRHRKAISEPSLFIQPAPDKDLEPYLSLVDNEIRQMLEGGHSPISPTSPTKQV